MRRYNPLNVGTLQKKLDSYYRNPSDKKRKQLEGMLQKAVAAMKSSEEAMSNSTRRVISLFKEFLEYTKEEETPPKDILEEPQPAAEEEILQTHYEPSLEVSALSIDQLRDEVRDMVEFYGGETKAAKILGGISPAQISSFLVKGRIPRVANRKIIRDAVQRYREVRQAMVEGLAERGHFKVVEGKISDPGQLDLRLGGAHSLTKGEVIQEIRIMLKNFENNPRAASKYLGEDSSFKRLGSIKEGRVPRGSVDDLRNILKVWWSILLKSQALPIERPELPPEPSPLEEIDPREGYEAAQRDFPELAQIYGESGPSEESFIELVREVVQAEGGFKKAAEILGGGSIEYKARIISNAYEGVLPETEDSQRLLVSMIELWLQHRRAQREQILTEVTKVEDLPSEDPSSRQRQIRQESGRRITQSFSARALRATANNPDKVFTFADFGIITDKNVKKLRNQNPEIRIVSSGTDEDPETGETINIGTFKRAGGTVFECPMKNKYKRIAYATDVNGKEPARRGLPSWSEFYKDRNKDAQARKLFVALFQRICDSSDGKLQDGTLFKKVHTTGKTPIDDRLWEFKVSNKAVKIRIVCFMLGDTIYLTNILYKNQSDAKLTSEYKRSEKIMKEHLAREEKKKAKKAEQKKKGPKRRRNSEEEWVKKLQILRDYDGSKFKIHRRNSDDQAFMDEGFFGDYDY